MYKTHIYTRLCLLKKKKKKKKQFLFFLTKAGTILVTFISKIP